MERQQASRGIVSHARQLLRRLNLMRGHFDRARATDAQAVLGYFKAPEQIVTETELTGLEAAIQSALKLDLACLDAWRRTVDALKAAQSSHEGLRKLTGLSGQRANVDQRADGYRQLIREAQSAMRGALRKTRPHADAEAQRAIDAELEEAP